MLGLDLVAIDLFAAELAVERVQVQAMFAGNERERLVEIGPEFIRSARLAWVIAGHGDTTAKTFTGVFKASYVIALPAMQRDRNAGERGHCSFRIHAHFGVTGFGG